MITDKFKSLFRILSDALVTSNMRPQLELFDKLLNSYVDREQNHEGLVDALARQPVTMCASIGTWEKDRDEYVLKFSSTLFADSAIRAFVPANYEQILIFLPGSMTAAEEVMRQPEGKFFLKEFCRQNSIALFVWDWPLQGSRKANSNYRGVRSHAILEGEYSRFLPIYGSSLWHEYLAELKFCIGKIGDFTKDTADVAVMGWSQGAWFAYFAPLLGLKINKVIAAGSCATFSDLLKNGATHRHGFFYYPLNIAGRFDLELVVHSGVKLGTSFSVLFGDEDPGCFRSSAMDIQSVISKEGLLDKFIIKEFQGVGHTFTNELRDAVLKIITDK